MSLEFPTAVIPTAKIPKKLENAAYMKREQSEIKKDYLQSQSN